MKIKLYYFLLGFVSMAILSIALISHNATPTVDTVCSKCGSQEWWFILAEGE